MKNDFTSCIKIIIIITILTMTGVVKTHPVHEISYFSLKPGCQQNSKWLNQISLNPNFEQEIFTTGDSVKSQVSISDSLAMVALYNATNGPNWTNNTDWLTGTLNTWYGITMLNNHVTEIMLIDNNLNGMIPNEIGNLAYLEELILYGNQIIGTIPVEIGNIINLEYLNLSNNQLSGNIPVEIGNLSNLTNIDFSYNQLTGSLPVEVCNIPNLSTFSCWSNNLGLGSCPAIECLLDNGVNLSDPFQNNGLDLISDCGLSPMVEIGADRDSVCADGSSYFFETVNASYYYSFHWEAIGGYGYFDDPNILQPTYYPNSDFDYPLNSINITVQVNGTSGSAFDNMELFFQQPLEMYAGKDAITNSLTNYPLNDAYAMNYSIIEWATDGDGTFENQNLINTVYFPGIYDLENNCVNLALAGLPIHPCSMIALDTLQVCFYDLVSNVTAAQRTDGSKKVDVYYDLLSQRPGYAILQEVSFDGGENFQTLDSVSGDVGDNVPPGAEKHILWNVGSEIPDFSTDSAIFKITANPGQWQCGDTLFDPRDNLSYKTVQIGIQCWMAENINTGVGVEGLQPQSNNYVIEKYCYNNNIENCEIYGGLYQWDETIQYMYSPGEKGICVDGWHIPTVEEWIELIIHLGGEAVAGGKMKETGFLHWNAPNTGATNISGFTALPGGFSSSNHNYNNLGFSGNWWTSTMYDDTYARYVYLSYNTTNAFIPSNSMMNSFSVRCIKDN